MCDIVGDLTNAVAQSRNITMRYFNKLAGSCGRNAKIGGRNVMGNEKVAKSRKENSRLKEGGRERNKQRKRSLRNDCRSAVLPLN